MQSPGAENLAWLGVISGLVLSAKRARVFGILAVVLLVTGGAIVYFTNRAEECIPLTMWSSDEKASQLSLVAFRFQRNGPTVDGKCVSVKIRVTGSRATTDVFAQDPEIPWDEPEKPHLWSPSSSVWVERLRASLAQRPGRLRQIPANLPSLATSPVVIAMPRQMAAALGWPEAHRLA